MTRRRLIVPGPTGQARPKCDLRHTGVGGGLPTILAVTPILGVAWLCLAAMDRASRRNAGIVDRVRRFGIRPVDFVRAAERGLVVGRQVRASPGGAAAGADSRSGMRPTVSKQLGARMASRRASR